MAAQRLGEAPTGLTIGQVLQQLRIQFPELTSSKIRFLGDSNLVSPERLASGYRSYRHADVERLRVILGLQRDYFLPLKQIELILADIDAGKPPTLPGGSTVSVDSILSLEVRFTRSEMLKSAEATKILLDDAISMGLIPAAEIYTDDSLKTLKALVELQKAGIEPRHLRGLRLQAEKDADIVHSAVLPIVKSASRVSKQKAADVARDLAHNLEQVRIAVMMRSIDDLIG
jgi:DNA-binding transcriptional MerR regulator